MGNTNTHKVCSLGVEVTAKHEFRFLVPNHLVDEDGEVDEKIVGRITHLFIYGNLDIDNLETPHHNSCQVKGGVYVLDEEKEGLFRYLTFVEDDEGGVFE